MDERRSRDHAAGPEDPAAAMVMGNSERAWEEAYDLHFQTRDAQAAVVAMGQWRQAMLARAAAAEAEAEATPPGPQVDVVLTSDSEESDASPASASF